MAFTDRQPGYEEPQHPNPAPVDHALDQLAVSLDHLVKVVDDGGLDAYDNAELIGFMQSFERLRNRLPLVDHRVIADAEARGLADALAQPNVARMLVWTLRLSAGEAGRRVRAADALGERVSMLGQPLPPQRPTLAAAQRAGDVSPEQVHLIERALRSVDRPGFDPADIEAGERLLTAQAATFGPKILSQLAEQVVNAINPDGTLPQERLNHDRRHLSLRQTPDGAWIGEFRLTGALGAKLSAILGPLAKPRDTRIPAPQDSGASTDASGDPNTSVDDADDHSHASSDSTQRTGSASPAAGIVEADDRSYGQRLHDALEDVCDRMLRVGGLPDAGGTPATLIVTITLDDLLDRTGYGRTADGTLIPTGQVLALAAEADVIPTVLARSGAVLDQGRARRVATTSQTLALIARDGGCSFPGCDHPPDFCERHHVVEWISGGATNLGNLTLLCRYHHHNFAARGWTGAINTDGLPEWTPPKWVDRQQRPILNNRIRLDRRRATREAPRGSAPCRP